MSAVCCPELISQKTIDAVQRAMGTLQVEREQLENFVEGLLDELEIVRSELQRRDDQIANERSDLALAHHELDQLRSSLAQQQTATSDANLQEIGRLKLELNDLHTDRSRHVAENEQLTSSLERAHGKIHDLEVRIAELVEERRAIQTQLDSAVDELAQLAIVRGALQEAQGELATMRTQLDDTRRTSQEELRKEQDQHHRCQDAWERERHEFEIRQQSLSAELAESRKLNDLHAKEVAELKKYYEAQQRDYLEEVRSLRESIVGHDMPFSVMDDLAGNGNAGSSRAEHQQKTTAAGSSNSSSGTDVDTRSAQPVDRVVGSVLQKLQKMGSDKKPSQN